MSWFRIDDGFHAHPKAVLAGNAACGLWVRCGAYCAAYLTDGFVPEPVARGYGTDDEIAALIEVGLWVECDRGYQMHEYLDRNPAKAEVVADRRRSAERMANVRANNGRTPGERSGGVQVPRPDPTRPTVKDKTATTPAELSTGSSSSSDLHTAVVDELVLRATAGKRNVKDPIAYAVGTRAKIEAEKGALIDEILATNAGFNLAECVARVVGEWDPRRPVVPLGGLRLHAVPPTDPALLATPDETLDEPRTPAAVKAARMARRAQ